MTWCKTLSVAVAEDSQDAWLERFYRGDRAAIAQCYREHFGQVQRVVSRLLQGADQETVIHDVFCNLIADEGMRRRFRGGSFAAWLTTVARNRAIDYLRRRRRENLVAPERAAALQSGPRPSATTAAFDARCTIERFRTQHLPAKWAPVFEKRFMEQLSQRDAAAALGMRRTTLAYQEQRIRRLLRSVLLGPVGDAG